MLSTGRTRSLGHIRGPLQFGMARSISPVYPVDHAITRVTQTTQADIDAGERTEMGGKWTIPYALYQAEMHYSATRGTQTRVTPDDLRLLYITLLNMFDHDRSATRGIMATRGYTCSAMQMPSATPRRTRWSAGSPLSPPASRCPSASATTRSPSTTTTCPPASPSND